SEALAPAAPSHRATVPPCHAFCGRAPGGPRAPHRPGPPRNGPQGISGHGQHAGRGPRLGTDAISSAFLSGEPVTTAWPHAVASGPPLHRCVFLSAARRLPLSVGVVSPPAAKHQPLSGMSRPRSLFRSAEGKWSALLFLTALCGFFFFYGISAGELWRT